MKLEQVSPNLTFYWSDEENFELHKALLFGTSSRSLKTPEERKTFYEGKGLTSKADNFFIQNLGFGDRSIAEQFNLNFEFNNVPASFSLDFLDFEYMSPIESSTRYLRIPEDYFYKFEHLSYMSGYDKYLENCYFSMEMYNKTFDELGPYYNEKFPFESIEWGNMSDEDARKAYASTIKSKTADAAKIFLPLSVNTNFTVCMNARAMQDLIGELIYSSVANDNFMKPLIDPLINYLQTDSRLKSLFSKLPETIKIASQRVANIHMRLKPMLKANVWGQSGTVKAYNLTKDTVPVLPQKMPRINRHDKVDESYKLNQFLFSITSSIAAFRDLNRHRQVEKHKIAYHNPITLLCNDDIWYNFYDYIDEYYQGHALDEIPSKSGTLRYMGFPLGTAMKWHLYANLFEVSNIVELRSAKGGYWEYIQLARDIAKSVGLGYNLFQEADMTTDYNETLPTLRQEMKKQTVTA